MKNVLLMLHPIMPYVTEEIFEKLFKSPELAILSSWPKTINPKDSNENRKPKESLWADEIKCELLPGETCPACHEANHNVYKTGCPMVATFATCSIFMRKTPKEN
mgnify:CR=1 FL=1